ncbi:MAG TPA: S8 family serine peptidase [Methylocella sp.]|nr:S8 family serine peptidase [Methylocella sp.]
MRKFNVKTAAIGFVVAAGAATISVAPAAAHSGFPGGAGHGLIFVAPVGNEGRSAKPLYPAAYEDVIAMTNRGDGVFKEANLCPAACVAAPGVDVLVAEPGQAYGILSGTSMAALM